MTEAQIKAKELVDIFGRVHRKYNTNELLFSERIIGKELALIHLERTLNLLSSLYHKGEDSIIDISVRMSIEPYYNSLLEIKREIESL